MNSTSLFKTLLFGLTTLMLVSCDKDFNELGSDIIGDDHFGFIKDEATTVIANNVSTGPVQSNNLEVNPLGIYTNPVFGKTTANFVTQLELGTVNPTFTTIINPPSIESVRLSIPYYSTLTSTDGDGVNSYELDSIYGPTSSRMKLSVYRNRYFLQNIDHEPDGSQQQQRYYSDQDAEINAMLQPGDLLNDANDVDQNDQFHFDYLEYPETYIDSHNESVTVTHAPGMYLDLNEDKFEEWILNAAPGKLLNNNVFKDYFRGLYFKVEDVGQPGQLAMLNFKGGKITIRYTEDRYVANDTPETTDDEVTTVHKVLVLNMAGNTVSLLNNSNENANYTTAINLPYQASGVEKLYLKGGHGSVATIDLFGPDNTNDGIPEELETLRLTNWQINEANLTFYVDHGAMASTSSTELASEPYRIYLYDIKNRMPIVDYIYDNSTASNLKFSKVIHGGIVERSADAGGRGYRYKIRLTNYIRDLKDKDSTNVKLGLCVTESIAMATMAKLKNTNPFLDDFVPVASVMNPLGTIIYGNNLPVSDPKRLKLEIYYTKPN